MFKRIVLVLSTFFLAFSILSVSVLRSAAVPRVFSVSPSPTPGASQEEEKIDYELAYPGSILPDHPLWFLKALRDKLWYLSTFNSSRKAELLLLFADKRLASAKILFSNNKPGIAFSTLSKAEKYLEQAQKMEEANRKKGMDTSEFLVELANASLKHREEIQKILVIAPDDAKPEIIKVEDYAINTYKQTRDALNSLGVSAPKSPFLGD